MVFDEEEVLNKFSIWSKAVLLCEVTKPTTLNELSKLLNHSKSNPYFYKLISFLEDKGFILVDRGRVPHIYKIKTNELAWYLRDKSLFYFSEILIKKSMGLKPYYYG